MNNQRTTQKEAPDSLEMNKKGKARSLKQQLHYCITAHDRTGHNDKIDRTKGIDTSLYYYSEEEIFMHRKRVKPFCSFMKKQFPEVRLARDLESKHVQAYLDKEGQNWKAEVKYKYANFFRKLYRIINDTYGCATSFLDVQYGYFDGTFDSLCPMCLADQAKIQERLLKKETGAKFVPLMVRSIGATIPELVNLQPDDIDLEQRTIKLKSGKGNKSRTVRIRDTHLPLWKYLKDYFLKNNWKTAVKGTKEGNVREILRKALKEAGLELKYKRGCCEPIRKFYFAERLCEELQIHDFNIEKAWLAIQKELGEGSDMNAKLFKRFIGMSLSAYRFLYLGQLPYCYMPVGKKRKKPKATKPDQ